MTLKATIYMCLALWNPDGVMHSGAEGLLSYWYNQTMHLEQGGAIPTEKFLPFEELERLITLPNSAYHRITECLKSPSEEA